MDHDPSERRLAAAFGLAALAAVGAATVELDITGPYGSILALIPAALIVGLPIALLHVVLLAWPAYSILRRRWRLRWWNAALAGFIIGTAPAALFTGEPDITLGLCGLLGGLVFRASLAAEAATK